MGYKRKMLPERKSEEAQRNIQRKKESLERSIANFREFVDNLPENIEVNESFLAKIAGLEGGFNKNYTEARKMGIDVSSYYDQYLKVIEVLGKRAALTPYYWEGKKERKALKPSEIQVRIEEMRKKKEYEEQKRGRREKCETPMYNLTINHHPKNIS